MKKLISRGICLGLLICLMTSCTKKPEPISRTGFMLDTVVTIDILDNEDKAVLDGCFEKIAEYEKIFSRTDSESELWAINHRNPDDSSIEVSEPMRELIEKGIYYCELSDGALDFTIAPLSDLWDFKGQEHSVPPEDKLEEVRKYCDYRTVSLSGNTLTFSNPHTQLDFGAFAKGYIADKIREYLLENNVSSAIIDLGGNVLCVGKKPDGSDFKIGVRKPFSREAVRIVSADNLSVVSSGVYERYFEENGNFYHHILNPKTGYPYQNGLLSVTILSESSLDGDGFSTLLFSLGLDDGMKLVNSIDGIEAFFITEDYSIYYSDGAEELLLPEQKG